MSTPELFVRLLGSIRDHLTAHPLTAEIESINVVSFEGGIIDVHLTCGDRAQLAAELLAWADTLTQYYPSALFSLYTDHVHLRITSQLPDTTWIEVYGTVPYTDTTFGNLQRGNLHHLTVTDLHTWAAGDGTVTP